MNPEPNFYRRILSRFFQRFVQGFLLFFATSMFGAESVSFEPIWSLPAGSRDYLTTEDTERSVAIHPDNGHVYLLSGTVASAGAPGFRVMILDGATGEELGELDTSGIVGGTIPLNALAVADDGVIYGANLVVDAAFNSRFTIYRWSDESAAPTVAFQGDLDATGMRFGDSLDARGEGAETQLATGAGDSNTDIRFAVFASVDGVTFTGKTFSPELAPDRMRVVAFTESGAVIGKSSIGPAVHASFHMDTGVSEVLGSVGMRTKIVGMDYFTLSEIKVLGGVDVEKHELVVFDAADFPATVEIKVEPFPDPVSGNPNELSSVAFGNGKLIALDGNNGLVAMEIVISDLPEPPSITVEPKDVRVLEGGPFELEVGATGTTPFSYQWFLDGNELENETNALYHVSPSTQDDEGSYTVRVSNVAGDTLSKEADVDVVPLIRSDRFAKRWSAGAGDRPYLRSDFTHRGLAYNPVSNHVLIASRSLGQNQIYVLDGETGADLHRLRTTDENGFEIIFGGFYSLNMVDVAEDGAVYACNLSEPNGNRFLIYRWADDQPGTIPTLAYPPANPGVGLVGDSISVRGSGRDTQIIVGARGQSKVVIFRENPFQPGLFYPTVIHVPEAGVGDFALSVDFGEGDTFWGKSSGKPLRHVSYDLDSGTGTLLSSVFTQSFPVATTVTEFNRAQGFIAAIGRDNPDHLQLYSFSTLDTEAQLVHQELFDTFHDNFFGSGSIELTEDRIYALQTNNGFLALEIGEGSGSGGGGAVLSNVQLFPAQIRFTVTGNEGGQYRVQSAPSVTGPWTAMTTITGSGEVTDNLEEKQKFYRAVSP